MSQFVTRKRLSNSFWRTNFQFSISYSTLH